MPRGLSRTCHLCSPVLPLEPVSPSICLLVSGPDGRILLARKSALYGEDQRTLCSFIMFLRPFDRCSSSPVEGNFFIFASVGLFFLKPVGNTCSCFFIFWLSLNGELLKPRQSLELKCGTQVAYRTVEAAVPLSNMDRHPSSPFLSLSCPPLLMERVHVLILPASLTWGSR